MIIDKSVMNICIFFIGIIVATSGTAVQRAFNQDSIQIIETSYTNKPFLFVVWSIECEPCRDELKLLGQLRQQHKNFNLVLLSTDNIIQQAALNAVLTQYKLDNIESWAFAHSNTQQLRYAIDSAWFGELPRSYFYNTKHVRTAVSGKLRVQSILNWMKSNSF